MPPSGCLRELVQCSYFRFPLHNVMQNSTPFNISRTQSCEFDTRPRIKRILIRLCTKSPYRSSSLCSLRVLCASVVKESCEKTTTEAQRTQRLHREIRLFVQSHSLLDTVGTTSRYENKLGRHGRDS